MISLPTKHLLFESISTTMTSTFSSFDSGDIIHRSNTIAPTICILPVTDFKGIPVYLCSLVPGASRIILSNVSLFMIVRSAPLSH